MNNFSSSLNGWINTTEREVQLFLENGTVINVETVIKLLMSALVAIASLVGNVSVIVVVFKTKMLHTNTFFLIVNMSVSDLFYTVLATPSFMTGILGHTLSIKGPWGTFICKFFNAASFGLIASSVLSLAAISCDRFFAIVYPVKSINTKTYLKYIVISIWVSSVLVMTPMLYAMRLGEEDGFVFCYEDWSSYFNSDTASKGYTVALFIVVYMVPFTAMLTFYSLISYFLWFRKTPGVSSSKSGKPSRKTMNRHRIIRMLLTLVLCFIICWLPLQIVTFSYFFGDNELPGGFFFASEFLIRANGAVNPIIYTLFSGRFRGGLKSLRFCTIQPKRPYSTGNSLPVTPNSKDSNNHIRVAKHPGAKRKQFYQETHV